MVGDAVAGSHIVRGVSGRSRGLGVRRSWGRGDLADDARLAVWPEAELRMDLAAAIASLPPQDRDAVLLRDIEERTLDEIALGLGLTREAVKGRRRGRGRESRRNGSKFEPEDEQSFPKGDTSPKMRHNLMSCGT